MELAHAFGSTLATLPRQVPYIYVEPAILYPHLRPGGPRVEGG